VALWSILKRYHLASVARWGKGSFETSSSTILGAVGELVGEEVGFEVVGFAVVGFAVFFDLREVGFAVFFDLREVGFAVFIDLRVVGFAVVGFAVFFNVRVLGRTSTVPMPFDKLENV
jgi:hypothetical protein